LLPSHGANPHLLLQRLKINEKQSVIDFSVNVNPLGVPGSIVELWPLLQKAAFSYPSVQAEELTAALALHLNVKQNEVLVTNGAAEAFFLTASLLAGKKNAIVDPTFVEYRQACESSGCDIISVPLDEREGWQWSIGMLLDVISLVDAIWICHPNNPTGVMYPLNEWEVLLEQAKVYNTILVIDEAFLDFVDSPVDFIPYLKRGYPIILVRSMTKMFHIAGIRLGYVISSPEIISSLSKRQPPWSVNGVAQQIGIACLRETPFVHETIAFVKKEREWLMEQLLLLGLFVSPSVTNFFLCSIPEGWTSRDWLMYLAKEGMVVRHTENFNGLNGRFIRLAVKTRSENERLIQTIKKGMTGYAHLC
jgi:threonine-phosphate decarboxylase